MGFVDRSRIEKRLAGAARAAYLWGSLGLILVCLLWWAGRVDFGGAMLGIVLAGGIAVLGYRTEQGGHFAAAGLVLLGAASVAYAFHHQPFTVDLLGLAALVFFVRGLLAARELRHLEAREAEALRRKEEKAATKAERRARKKGGKKRRGG
jgi:hypothetical protein